MPDETLKTFRRLVREAHQQMKIEKVPAQRESLAMLLAARRMDLERYQRSANAPQLRRVKAAKAR